MAIYHLEAKVVSRGRGRSAVAAAAYMSCSEILNDYDGVRHDYTRKRGLVWAQVFLPSNAPSEWTDRSVLWNAVEENEKTKDSRLARELVVALPLELVREEWKKLLTEYVRDNFVEEGMCADVCIHDTDGHNPHAHIMVTVRPLDENGKWQYKTEKEYLCMRDGEEKGFTGTEYKQAKNEGWEKQYQYKVDGKKIYMTPSAAQMGDYERASKTPKSTRFGRQNPITQRWNSDEQLVLWRSAWADVNNRYLERIGLETRIDHRSHADRGIAEQPTIHEGVVAREMEKKGGIADRCEINRQIKADNKLLRELRDTIEKIAVAIKNSVPAIAEAMEALRQNLILIRYQILHTHSEGRKVRKRLYEVRPIFRRYTELVAEIKDLSRERKGLQSEKKESSKLNILKQRDLSQKIAQLSEKIEELRSEKLMIMNQFHKADDDGMKELNSQITSLENRLRHLEQVESGYQAEMDAAFEQFEDLTETAQTLDKSELHNHRRLLRKSAKEKMTDRLRRSHGDRYNPVMQFDAEHDVDGMLREYERKLKPEKKYQKGRTAIDFQR